MSGRQALGFLFLSAAAAMILPFLANADLGVVLQDETLKLEIAMQENRISTKERERLAGIYFMTRRCVEAGKALEGVSSPEAKQIRCACGLDCTEADSATYRLKKLVESGQDSNSADVRRVFDKSDRGPFAQYWYQRAIAKTPLPHSKAMRARSAEILRYLDSVY